MSTKGRRATSFALLVFAARLAAQDASADLPTYIAPGSEAPEALLSVELGTSDAQLFVEGTWKLGLEAGVGLRLSPGTPPVLTSGVGTLANGLVFRQEPAVSLSALLLDRFFLETEIRSPGQRASSFLPSELGYLRMGYRAPGDELLRSVVLGTKDVGMTPYPFLSVPSMGPNSLGASAVVQGPITTQEILLRVDRLPAASVRFVGSNRVTEERVPIGRYLRAQVYLLPDRDVRDLVVLVEDPKGEALADDGRRYRPLVAAEGSVSALEGTISLHAPPAGGILVWYRNEAGVEVGDPSLGAGFLPTEIGTPDGPTIDPDGPGVDFRWGVSYLGVPMDRRQVAIDGRVYLLIGRPGEFSPFELASTYQSSLSVSGAGAAVLDVVRRGSDTTLPDSPRLVLVQADQGARLVATRGGEPRSDIRERYPFDDEGYLLYGPHSPPPSGYADGEIRARVLDPVEYLSVPPPVVPGSVRVIRGGIDDPRVTVDYATGRVDLATPPAPGEEIRILYRAAEGTADTDLVVAWGNRIALGDRARIELAGGLLWNTTADAFTSRAGEATGGLSGTASLTGEYASPAGQAASGPLVELDYAVAAAVTLSQPDTTGVRRLFGMEGSTRAVALSAELARPSSPPQLAGSDQSNRGVLVYRDYHRYGLLGGALLREYDDPVYVEHAYVEGEIAGPYDVGTGSQGVGKGLALQFGLSAGQTWAGMQMPVSPGAGLADLSGTQTIVVSFRAEAASGSYAIWLEAGALSEDLDGDGVLDREQSVDDRGFAFDDAGNGVSLKVGAGPRGQGNGTLDTEDQDGNGYLDPEEPALRYPVATVSTGGAPVWATHTHTVTPEERRLLSRTRSLRLVVLREGADRIDGRVIVDRIELAGSTFWASPAGSGTVSIREVGEGDLAASLAAPETLEAAFPEVSDRFHPGGAVQKTLEVVWSGLAPADVVLRGFADGGSGGIPYRDLRAYLRIPTLSSQAELSVDLVDGDGQGVHARFTTVAFAGWAELSVDTTELSVSLDGVPVPGAEARVDAGRHDLVELRVAVVGAGDGVLYLDEVRLTRPSPGVGGAAQASAALAVTGSLLAVGDHVLVSGLRAALRTTASTASFTPLFGQPSSQPVFRADGDLGLDTSIGRVAVRVGVDGDTSGVELSGGHDLDLGGPAEGAIRLRYRDTFAVRGTLPDYTHDASAGMSAGWLGVGIGLGSTVSGTTLTQKWSADLGVTPGRLPRMSLAMNAAKRATGYDPGVTGYPGWWLQGYRLVVPWTSGSDASRSAQTRARVWIEPRPIGVETRAETGFVTAALPGDERTQTTSLSYGLGVPVQFRPGGGPEVTIAAGYENALTLTSLRAEGRKDLVEDIEVLGAVLGHHIGLLSAFPVYDVLSTAALVDNEERLRTSNDFPLAGATWGPRVTLSFKRGVGSRVGDLFLPSYLDVALGRRVVLAGDLTEAATTLRAGLRFSALNLFGRLGSSSIVSLYDTDELSATASATATLPLTPTATRPWELGLEVAHLGSFAADTTTLVLENKLRLDLGEATRVTEAAEARLSWTQIEGIAQPAVLERLGLAPERARKKGALVHVERAAVSVDTVAADGRAGVVFTVGHQTRVEYPDLGFASARAGLAVDMRHEGASDPWSIAIGGEVGIEIEIRF